MTKRSFPSARRRWSGRAVTATLGAAALAAALAPLATSGSASAATAASAAVTSHKVAATGGSFRLHRIGTVNVQALAKADAARMRKAASKSSSTTVKHVVPLRLPHGTGASASAIRQHAVSIRAAVMMRFFGNVRGAHGFDGITAAINGAANSPDIGGVGDVSPPDQGLAVGPSSAGTAVVEFVNDTLNIYTPGGKTLLGAVPAFQIFGLPSSAFLSDPRAYRDPATGHWFLTMFTFGDGVTAPLSTQYIAVSQTTSPFGPYTTFGIDTSDSANTAGGCPCFGDYDMVGMDNSGFYITTNQFSVDGPNFNGTVMYAMSKRALVRAAINPAISPVVQTYTVPFASDPYAAYHLSPSMYAVGGGAPNTEYFVESNSNLNYGHGLEIYALLNTGSLNAGGRPTLVETKIRTEPYSFPPNALQKSGPTPYGCSLGFCATAQLETDFNAVQEVTYAGGKLYAELDTGFNYGTGQNSGAAWFVLAPRTGASWVGVKLVSNGYVKTSQNVLYPVIGVNKNGVGYLSFALSGPKFYPSAAYMAFEGAKGAVGRVHIAARGVNPLDDFTCYPPIGGACRYGDYSMSQFYGGRIWTATEYVAPQPRDVLSNWGTRVWSAPLP